MRLGDPIFFYLSIHGSQTTEAYGSEFALRLHTSLKERGLNVWLDRYNIDPGKDFYVEIDNTIRTSAAMIVVLTPGSVLSLQVKSEWNNAINRPIPVIPIMAKNCDVPAFLNIFKWVDFRSDYDEALDTLVKRLETVESDHLADMERLLREYSAAGENAPAEFQRHIQRLQAAIADWESQQALPNNGELVEEVHEELSSAIDADRERVIQAAAAPESPDSAEGDRFTLGRCGRFFPRP